MAGVHFPTGAPRRDRLWGPPSILSHGYQRFLRRG